MTDQPAPLRIDIVSDVVCPWCIIGYRQLALALKATGTVAEVHWHPFELNPNMPAEGQNLREHIAEKYGASAEQSEQTRAQMTELGKGLDITFSYGPDSRIRNTFGAHQLIHWAETLDREHDMKMALFSAYFTEGRDVADPTVLAEIAGSIGLDRDAATEVLEDGRYAADVRQAEHTWTSRGIQGVPAMVFDSEHLVTGAQGEDNYKMILQKLAEMRVA
jgi:predicted DsbA family dithiol-disulfide isomerase